MHRWIRFAVFVLIASQVFAQTAPEAGKPLPPWSEGTLDIHQISTGRGNGAFLRFPDGTTLLVDAGAAGNGKEIPYTDLRPDASRNAGGWIARYIANAMAPEAPRLDFALLTHFHGDHIGQATDASPMSKRGAYRLSGITEVGDEIPIGTLIDRGSGFLPPPVDDSNWKNYAAFADEAAKRGTRHEPIRPGRNDQIVLKRKPAAFPSFEVRNVYANGDAWTGEAEETRFIFPPLDTIAKEDTPTENMCSAALRIRYGKFDYFTGGDIQGVPDAGEPEWTSVERAVARAIGPTDVLLVNHHGSIDNTSAEFLATLRPQVIVIPAWSPTHPSQDVLKRIMATRLYPGTRDVFVTTLRATTRTTFGPRVDQLKAEHGHIVVRVAPGGDSFRVYVLDDTTPDANVVSVHGPYTAR